MGGTEKEILGKNGVKIIKPAERAKYGLFGPLDPPKHLILSVARERAIQFEGRAVYNHGSMAKKAFALDDYGAHNLATTILAGEAKDKQHSDMLKSLEAR